MRMMSSCRRRRRLGPHQDLTSNDSSTDSFFQLPLQIYLKAHRISPFYLTNTHIPHTMATQQAADAVKDGVQAVADKVSELTTSDNTTTTQPTLLKDEVTGEMVSKTELKKRQKAREKEAKKAEAAASRQAPPAPKRKAADDEAQLNPNVSRTVNGRDEVCYLTDIV